MVAVSAEPVSLAIPADCRILRRAEVEQKVGLKRGQIYQLMKAEQFPKAVRLGIRAVGWYSVEIDAWIAERLKHRI